MINPVWISNWKLIPTANKAELTVTLVNNWKGLIDITKNSMLDVTRVVDTTPSDVNMTSKWRWKWSLGNDAKSTKF